MPGRRGTAGVNGTWQSTGNGGTNLPANPSYDSRTGNTPAEYKATQSIEFLPGFESGEGDAFEAFITTADNSGSGTGSGVALDGSGYRYGFNGKENDNEVEGEGNQQDYGMRIYDPRLGRFLSVDPLTGKYPFYTPYQFAGNNPVISVDIDGMEGDKKPNSSEKTGDELRSESADMIKKLDGHINNIGIEVQELGRIDKKLTGEQKKLDQLASKISDVSNKTKTLKENLTDARNRIIKWQEEMMRSIPVSDDVIVKKLLNFFNPIEDVQVYGGFQAKETGEGPKNTKVVLPTGVQSSYSLATGKFKTNAITPLNATYYNVGLEMVDFRYRAGESDLNTGEFFKWRTLITVGRPIPIGPFTTFKSQLDLTGSGLNFNSLQPGGRFVIETKVPSLFFPAKSSFEINTGFRVKLNSAAFLNRLNSF